MATTQEQINLKLNAQQAIDIMLEPVFTDSLLRDSFTIYKNFYGGEYRLGLLTAMKNVVSRQQACSPKYKGEATMSERTFKARYCQAGIEFCWEEFLNTQYDYLAPFFTTQNGAVNASTLVNLFTKLLGDAIVRDVERAAWYGDESSTDDAINWVDGVFKHLGNLIITGEIGYRVDSTQGTQLNNSQAYDLLKDVIKNAPTELKRMSKTDKVIHINGLLWEQILEYLSDNAVNNGFINVFEEPLDDTVATVRGIPVLVHYSWDDISNEYFNGAEFQNKIVYTAKSNLAMGTDLRPDAAPNSASFKAYQDPKTDVISLESKFILAVDYVWPKLFSVAL